MKLVSARAYAIQTPPPNLGGVFWFFVRLETDDGRVGWGECAVLFSMYGLHRSFEQLVEDNFNRYLAGQDPLNREVLTKRMYEGLTSQNAGYFSSGVISAFDVAMWDICGQHFDAPICDLLGGRYRERIRTYTYMYADLKEGTMASTTGDWRDNPEGVAEIGRKLVGEGFTGLKLDPIRYDGPAAPHELPLAEYDQAERTIELLRNAIGNQTDILIGTHGQMTPSVSRRLAKRLEKFDPLWLEEPCPPENAEEMARIAASTSIPIATGERLAFVYDFERLFSIGACHYAQPDLGSCGGFTGARQIATLAETHYVLLAPHVWGGPIITAAALQLDAAIPNFLIQESIHKSGLFFDEILKEPFVWEDGDLLLPDRPGLGFALDEEKLEPYLLK